MERSARRFEATLAQARSAKALTPTEIKAVAVMATAQLFPAGVLEWWRYADPMIDYNVPYYQDMLDGTHCFQASIKMILKYFWPNKEYSWEELEKITAKVEGKWTWPYAGLLWMHEKGFEIKTIEAFDNGAFANNGEKYLSDFFGDEVAKQQIENSDISQELRLAKDFVEKINAEARIPSVEDIKTFLEEGFLVCCNVNSRILNDLEGYVGHFVVIKGFDDQDLIVHDPGRRGSENRKVSFEQFEKAWAYPDEQAKNIIAIRLKQ